MSNLWSFDKLYVLNNILKKEGMDSHLYDIRNFFPTANYGKLEILTKNTKIGFSPFFPGKSFRFQRFCVHRYEDYHIPLREPLRHAGPGMYISTVPWAASLLILAV